MRTIVCAVLLCGTLSGCRLLYDDDGGPGAIEGQGCAGAACEAACDLPGEGTYLSTHNGHCYTLQSTPLDGDEAREACQAVGAHGVTFESFAELQDVLANFDVDGEVWMGLSDSNGNLVWQSGEPIGFANWQPGEPDLSVTRPAGVLTSDGSWFLADEVVQPRPVICERDLVQAESGNVYVKFDDPVSWDVAKVLCESRAGHLATIVTADEAAAIRPLNFKEVWLGLSDADSEGVFEWVTGEPLALELWRGSEPDGGELQNCVLSVDGGWDDRLCATPDRYICEFDAP